MEIKEMQKAVDDWVNQYTVGYWKPNNMMLRLMEEVGELAREINHRFGEKPKKPTEDLMEIGDELGDILFAMVCIANSFGIDLEESFKRIMEKYSRRDKHRYEKR